MKKLISLFILITLINLGCKSEEQLRKELSISANRSQKIDEQLEKGSFFEIPESLNDNAIYQDVIKKKNPNLEWFYDQYTDATWYYPLKINSQKFSSENYISLIRAVKNENPEKSMDRHCAAFALEFSLYKDLEKKRSEFEWV